MGCSHCMQCSTPDGGNMTTGIFLEAVKFAERSNVHVMLITGGEPTEHPDFEDIVAVCCRKFIMVIITTNGMWIDDPDKVHTMKCLFDKYDNLTMQVTNISKYYPKTVDTQRIEDLFGHNVAFETNHLNLLALGRASQDPDLIKESEGSLGTMSCFSSALVSAQLPYQMAIANMESRGKFCHPLIDYRGYLHWSESCQCPSFAHLSDGFDEIIRKAHSWRPCLQCHDADKLRNNTSSKYTLAKQILGLNQK